MKCSVFVSISVSSAPLTAAQLKSPPMTRPTAPVSEGSKFLPTSASKIMTTTTLQLLPSTVTSIQSSKATTTSTSVSKGGQPATATASVPSMALPLSLPYYMASMQKISHPILVTSLMAPALGLTTTATPVSSSVSNSALNLASSVIPVKTLSSANVKSEDITVGKGTPTTSVNFITTPVLSTTNAQTVTSSVVSSNFPVRPIFAPNLIAGQVWPFLTAVPRTSIIPTTSASTTQISTSLPSSSAQVSSVPVVSLTQLNQLTQMVTPVTVMSPGIQVTPTQLNSMMASPLLKQFPFPLGIPSSFLQPGQVLGQQVVKPVVVVSVPSIMSQSSTTVAAPPSVTVVTSSA